MTKAPEAYASDVTPNPTPMSATSAFDRSQLIGVSTRDKSSARCNTGTALPGSAVNPVVLRRSAGVRADPKSSAARLRLGPPNTADKLRSARPSTTPHDAHPPAERTEHHAPPLNSPRFVSFIRLLDSPTLLPAR